MKYLLFIMFLFLFHFSEACEWASQCRIFPIGVLGNNICVLETHLIRTARVCDRKIENCLFWKGEYYVRIYSKSNDLVKTISKDTFQVKYDLTLEQLKKIYKKEIIKAKKSNVIFFKPQIIKYGETDKNFYLSQLYFDSIKNDLFILYNNKQYLVHLLKDTNSIAKKYLLGIGANYSEEHGYNLSIGSQRVFKAKNGKLLVVHLMFKGQMDMPDDTDSSAEVKLETKFNNIKNTIFTEPDGWHSNGFDFFIWIN